MPLSKLPVVLTSTLHLRIRSHSYPCAEPTVAHFPECHSPFRMNFHFVLVLICLFGLETILWPLLPRSDPETGFIPMCHTIYNAFSFIWANNFRRRIEQKGSICSFWLPLQVCSQSVPFVSLLFPAVELSTPDLCFPTSQFLASHKIILPFRAVPSLFILPVPLLFFGYKIIIHCDRNECVFSCPLFPSITLFRFSSNPLPRPCPIKVISKFLKVARLACCENLQKSAKQLS